MPAVRGQHVAVQVRPHIEHADVGVVGLAPCLQLVVGIAFLGFPVSRMVVHRVLHVGLSGGQPHLAHEHIRQADLVLSSTDDHHLRSAVGRHCFQCHPPQAGLVGDSAQCLLVKRHLHLLACISHTPDAHGFLSLQHHVAAECLGHFDLCHCRRCQCQHGRYCYEQFFHVLSWFVLVLAKIRKISRAW